METKNYIINRWSYKNYLEGLTTLKGLQVIVESDSVAHINYAETIELDESNGEDCNFDALIEVIDKTNFIEEAKNKGLIVEIYSLTISIIDRAKKEQHEKNRALYAQLKKEFDDLPDDEKSAFKLKLIEEGRITKY